MLSPSKQWAGSSPRTADRTPQWRQPLRHSWRRRQLFKPGRATSVI